MQNLADAAHDAKVRLEKLAEYRQENRAEIIADGVARYGWSPDAECIHCGDTGMWPNSMSFCGCAAGRAKMDDEATQRRQADWERRWALTNVPRRFQRYRFDTSPLPDQVVQIARDWVSGNPVATATNLLVTGNVGTGKTGIAVGALWELHEAGNQPLWFISTSALIDSMKPGSEDSALVACQRAAVLVLDDLGTTRGTDWEQERLFALLNARYEDERPTIITTNVSIPDLAASVGARSVSRIMESHVIVPVDGPDMRRMSAGRRAA